jgi:hypothetical protein
MTNSGPEHREYWVHVFLFYPDDAINDDVIQNDLREALNENLKSLPSVRSEGEAVASMQGRRMAPPAPVPLQVVVSSDGEEFFKMALQQSVAAIQASRMRWAFTVNSQDKEWKEVSDKAWLVIQKMIAEQTMVWVPVWPFCQS